METLESVGFHVKVFKGNPDGQQLVCGLWVEADIFINGLSLVMETFEPGLLFKIMKPTGDHDRFKRKLEVALTLAFKYVTSARGGLFALSEVKTKLDEYTKQVSFSDPQLLLPCFLVGVPPEFASTVLEKGIPIYDPVVMAVADGLISPEEASEYWKLPSTYVEKLLYG